MSKKRRKKSIKAILVILLTVVLCSLIYVYSMAAVKLLSIAKEAKADLTSAVESFKEEDYLSVKKRVNEVRFILKDLKSLLQSPSWSFFGNFPIIGNDYKNGIKLISLSENLMDDLLDPVFDVLMEHPISSIKVDGGFDTLAIGDYLYFAERAVPIARNTFSTIEDMHFNVPILSNLFNKVLDKGNMAFDIYDRALKYFPLIHAFIGSGETKNYLLVAQNGAETRATGGFPGAMGTIRIENDILYIGGFKSVYDVISNDEVIGEEISDAELEMFYGWISAPRDACFLPNFQRAAEIWKFAYEERNNEQIDGVISLTPVIIQNLLKVIGEVEVFDGTILTGDNSTRILSHDIYWKYLSGTSNWGYGAAASDLVFSETAAIAMKNLVHNLSLSSISGLMDVFEQGVKDRIILMWMKNKEDEMLVEEIGCDGGLNKDPENPKVGLYYSICVSSKLGWYADFDSKIGDGIKRRDGCIEYPVTVTITNNVQPEDVARAGEYIVGIEDGLLGLYLNFLAPCGGTISNVKSSNNKWFEYTDYEGLEAAYTKYIYVEKGKSITITFTVTTAPGVTAPLGKIETPTLSLYNEF